MKKPQHVSKTITNNYNIIIITIILCTEFIIAESRSAERVQQSAEYSNSAAVFLSSKCVYIFHIHFINNENLNIFNYVKWLANTFPDKYSTLIYI